MSLRLSNEEYVTLIGRRHTGKQPPAPRATEEADFQRRVIELAERYGWLWHHESDSRRSEPGWPNFVLAKPGQPLVIAELKSRSGKVAVSQACWLKTLGEATGLQVRLWRPCDWPEIKTLLQP